VLTALPYDGVITAALPRVTASVVAVATAVAASGCKLALFAIMAELLAMGRLEVRGCCDSTLAQIVTLCISDFTITVSDPRLLCHVLSCLVGWLLMVWECQVTPRVAALGRVVVVVPEALCC